MKTTEIINEIQRLPLQKRIFVIEKTLQQIRQQEVKNEMRKSADALVSNYKTDHELTIFTDIDFEDFYETR